MKGDVGMSGHEKERKQEDAYTKLQTHSGFTEEDDDDDDDEDDTKIVKLRMSGFSRGKLEAGRIELGLCTARYESKSC